MANTNPQLSVDFATAADARRAVHGLKGIFFALNLLVVHHVGEDVLTKEQRDDGIDQLILAGEMLADEIIGRF